MNVPTAKSLVRHNAANTSSFGKLLRTLDERHVQGDICDEVYCRAMRLAMCYGQLAEEDMPLMGVEAHADALIETATDTQP